MRTTSRAIAGRVIACVLFATVVAAAQPARVLLDCYYNNEWKKNARGDSVRFHYVWDDTANSGFSQLGDILGGLGARLELLPGAPDAGNLAEAAIYIIVDPDTPRESPSPHVIEVAEARNIETWVRKGGILLLFGNDRENAEFEHLNGLATLFGITFNEDSRNRVTGARYETGAFTHFPRHPAFRGLHRIFLKEISTLGVKPPARALLTDGGDVIMAFARAGKGIVLAVGDPWFYNEYMDGRRLPPGYDNALAAKNLFRWLLSTRASPSGK